MEYGVQYIPPTPQQPTYSFFIYWMMFKTALLSRRTVCILSLTSSPVRLSICTTHCGIVGRSDSTVYR